MKHNNYTKLVAIYNLRIPIIRCSQLIMLKCLFQILLIFTNRVERRDLVPLHKKVPYILYSHLSSLDNLMMAYI